MQPTRNVFWTAELSFIAGVLGSYLQGVSNDAFAIRNEVAYYVDRCMAAGFFANQKTMCALVRRVISQVSERLRRLVLLGVCVNPKNVLSY